MFRTVRVLVAGAVLTAGSLGAEVFSSATSSESEAIPADELPALEGVVNGSLAGWSVVRIGDLDGDGRTELLVGAQAEDQKKGHTYLIFGQQLQSSQNLALSADHFITFVGTTQGQRSGWSSAGQGDFDGDGAQDFVIGAPQTDGATGEVYVLMGQTSRLKPPSACATSVENLQSLEDAALRIRGRRTNDWVGSALTFVPDLDGDGCDELVIGTPFQDYQGHFSSGGVFLFLGRGAGCSRPLPPTGSLTLDDSDAAYLDMQDESSCGYTLLSIQSLDEDPAPDLAVGCYGANTQGGYSSGKVLLFLNPTGGEALVPAAELRGQAGDLAGGSLAAIPSASSPISGLAIGCEGAANGAGGVYLLPPQKSWSGGDVSELASQLLVGESSGDGAGLSIATVPGTSPDGTPSLLVGAPYAHGDRGLVYLVSPVAAEAGDELVLVSLSQSSIAVEGGEGDRLGLSLAVSADDLGGPQLFLGSIYDDRGTTDGGAVLYTPLCALNPETCEAWPIPSPSATPAATGSPEETTKPVSTPVESPVPSPSPTSFPCEGTDVPTESPVAPTEPEISIGGSGCVCAASDVPVSGYHGQLLLIAVVSVLQRVRLRRDTR